MTARTTVRIRRLVAVAAAVTAAALALTGCVAGEGETQPKKTATAEPGAALGEGGWSAATLNIDYATYTR